MTVGLYLDHHVHSGIATGLRARGVQLVTCLEDGTEQLPDDQVLLRATQMAHVVFTQDDDFLAVAGTWLRDGRPFAGVAYAHPLRITVGQAIRDLEVLAKAMDETDMRNRIEYLPFRRRRS